MFNENLKVVGIMAIAGLVVAYVRQVFQFQKYAWDSVSHFLGMWLIHYFAVFMLVGIAWAIANTNRKFLFGKDAESNTDGGVEHFELHTLCISE